MCSGPGPAAPMWSYSRPCGIYSFPNLVLLAIYVCVLSLAWPQDYGKHLGAFTLQNGVKRSIEEAQAHRGFAHVSEAAIEALLVHKGWAVPPASSQTDADRKLELSLAAMSKIEPTWTDLEASKALHVCFMLENPDTYSDLPVDTSVIAEVVTATEAKTIHEFAASLEKVRARKTIRAHVRDTIMKKYFKTSALSQKKKPKAKAAPRWWPQKDENVAAVTKHVEENLPTSVRLYTDEANGRWRVISEVQVGRSISWTSRGLAKAAAEAVHQAWTFHLDAHPTDHPPFELQELATQFAAL